MNPKSTLVIIRDKSHPQFLEGRRSLVPGVAPGLCRDLPTPVLILTLLQTVPCWKSEDARLLPLLCTSWDASDKWQKTGQC